MPNETTLTTPSALQPKPAAAAPTAPPAAAAPPAPDELTASKAKIAEYETKLAAADKKLRVNGIEVTKVLAEKKQLGAKLTAHDRMEKALKAAGLEPEDLEQFKANPRRALGKSLGEKWYERLQTEQVNGGAPTAETLAAELARAKDEIRAEFRADAERAAAEAKQRHEESNAAAREELANDATAFLEKSAAEYPAFDGYQRAQVSRAIAQHIENEWNRTGKVLSVKDAADALEAAEYSRAERLAVKPKYASKLTEKLKGANVPPVASKNEGQAPRSPEAERRTLSNDLKASTQTARRSPRTDEERRAAIAAMELDLGQR